MKKIRYSVFLPCRQAGHIPYSVKPAGFTLVELLVVMAIIGILATLIMGGFRSSQARSRDARRKSDLKQIAYALEMFYADKRVYPASTNGKITGCWNTGTLVYDACTWGSGEMKDNYGTIYFKALPADPVSGQSYFYRTLLSGSAFQLYARLENAQDKNCLGGNCFNPSVPSGVACGSGINCNFSITSSNVTPTDSD